MKVLNAVVTPAACWNVALLSYLPNQPKYPEASRQLLMFGKSSTRVKLYHVRSASTLYQKVAVVNERRPRLLKLPTTCVYRGDRPFQRTASVSLLSNTGTRHAPALSFSAEITKAEILVATPPPPKENPTCITRFPRHGNVFPTPGRGSRSGEAWR